MRPSAGAGSRPWSRSARASANACGVHWQRRGPWAASVATSHGSNYLADDFQQEVAFFGIEKLPELRAGARRATVLHERCPSARSKDPNVLWVRSFDTIEELRLPCSEFKRTYNEQWMLENVQLPKPRSGTTRPRRAGRGSVEANTVTPLSKNPGAIH